VDDGWIAGWMALGLTDWFSDRLTGWVTVYLAMMGFAIMIMWSCDGGWTTVWIAVKLTDWLFWLLVQMRLLVIVCFRCTQQWKTSFA
jgi:hypothetical protein